MAAARRIRIVRDSHPPALPAPREAPPAPPGDAPAPEDGEDPHAEDWYADALAADDLYLPLDDG